MLYVTSLEPETHSHADGGFMAQNVSASRRSDTRCGQSRQSRQSRRHALQKGARLLHDNRYSCQKHIIPACAAYVVRFSSFNHN